MTVNVKDTAILLVSILVQSLSQMLFIVPMSIISHGYKRILIIAKDTGIIVQGISFVSDIGADKMWVPFGIGKQLRNISIHDSYSTMSSAKEKALPASHALFFFIDSSIVIVTIR